MENANTVESKLYLEYSVSLMDFVKKHFSKYCFNSYVMANGRRGVAREHACCTLPFDGVLMT